MSQAGLIDVEQANPQIPTMFITDDGTAVPIANTLELLGTVVSADGIPFRSVASGNTITYQIQYASAQPTSDPTAAGIASFDSSSFGVDANGFVTFTGGSGGIAQINGDASFVTGSTVTLTSGNSTIASGASVLFTGNGTTTMTLSVTDSRSNTFVGQLCGVLSPTSQANSGFGVGNLQSLDSGGGLANGGNTAIGVGNLVFLEDGINNTALGVNNFNGSLTSGNYNIGIGYNNGSGGSSDSDNIIIGSNIITGPESGVIRLGGATQTTCYISGIASVATSNSEMVTVDTTTGQLGSTTIPSGGITQINGDASFVTGSTITLTGGTTGLTFAGASTTLTMEGTLVVANGGTGKTSQTAYSLVAGGTTTTGAFQAVGPNSSSNAILYSTGTSSLPSFSTSGTPYVAGISFDSGSNTLANFIDTVSFTPTLTFGGGSTGITYSSRQGFYTRVGKIVSVVIEINLTSKGSSTGAATITGTGLGTPAGNLTAMATWRLQAMTWTGTPVFRLTSGTLYCEVDVTSTGSAAMDNTNFANNSSLSLCITYPV